MKKIGSFLNKNSLDRRTAIDEKSVFYVFQLVIKEEYGKQGIENIKPVLFKDHKIFIKTGSPIWDSEISHSRSYIIKKLNSQLGGEEIVDLAITE